MGARPGDWSPLKLDGDPTPGDPDVLLGVADYMDVMAENARLADSKLGQVVAQSGSGAFVGKTADWLRDQVTKEMRGFIAGVKQAFSATGPALRSYVAALRDAQAKADQALSQAAGASGDDARIQSLRADAQAAGDSMKTAASAARNVVHDASSYIKSPTTPKSACDIFWEIFGWITLVISIVAIFLGGPLGLIAFGLNAALAIKTLVDFTEGKTNGLGLFLGLLAVLGPSTRPLIALGDLTKLAGAAVRKLDQFAGAGAAAISKGVNDFWHAVSTISLSTVMKGVGDLGVTLANTVKVGALHIPQAVSAIDGLAARGFVTLTNFVVHDLPRAAAGVPVAVRSGLSAAGGLVVDAAELARAGLGKLGTFAADELGGWKWLRLFTPLAAHEIGQVGVAGAVKLGVLGRGLNVSRFSGMAALSGGVRLSDGLFRVNTVKPGDPPRFDGSTLNFSPSGLHLPDLNERPLAGISAGPSLTASARPLDLSGQPASFAGHDLLGVDRLSAVPRPAQLSLPGLGRLDDLSAPPPPNVHGVPGGGIDLGALSRLDVTGLRNLTGGLDPGRIPSLGAAGTAIPPATRIGDLTAGLSQFRNGVDGLAAFGRPEIRSLQAGDVNAVRISDTRVSFDLGAPEAAHLPPAATPGGVPTAVTHLNGAAVPHVDATVVPHLNGTVVPHVDGAAIPQSNGVAAVHPDGVPSAGGFGTRDGVADLVVPSPAARGLDVTSAHVTGLPRDPAVAGVPNAGIHADLMDTVAPVQATHLQALDQLRRAHAALAGATDDALAAARAQKDIRVAQSLIQRTADAIKIHALDAGPHLGQPHGAPIDAIAPTAVPVHRPELTDAGLQARLDQLGSPAEHRADLAGQELERRFADVRGGVPATDLPVGAFPAVPVHDPGLTDAGLRARLDQLGSSAEHRADLAGQELERRFAELRGGNPPTGADLPQLPDVPTHSPADTAARAVAAGRLTDLEAKLSDARDEHVPVPEPHSAPVDDVSLQRRLEALGRPSDPDLAGQSFPSVPRHEPVPPPGHAELTGRLDQLISDADRAGLDAGDIAVIRADVQAALDAGQYGRAAEHLGVLNDRIDRGGLTARLDAYRAHVDAGHERAAALGMDKPTWLQHAVDVERAASAGRTDEVHHLLNRYENTLADHLTQQRLRDLPAVPETVPVHGDGRGHSSADVGRLDELPATPTHDPAGDAGLSGRLADLRGPTGPAGMDAAEYDRWSADLNGAPDAAAAAGVLDRFTARVAGLERDARLAEIHAGSGPLPADESRAWRDAARDNVAETDRIVAAYDARLTEFRSTTDAQIRAALSAPDHRTPLNSRVDAALEDLSPDIRAANVTAHSSLSDRLARLDPPDTPLPRGGPAGSDRPDVSPGSSPGGSRSDGAGRPDAPSTQKPSADTPRANTPPAPERPDRLPSAGEAIAHLDPPPRPATDDLRPPQDLLGSGHVPAPPPRVIEVDTERWVPMRDAFHLERTGDGQPPRMTRPAGSGERTGVRYQLTAGPQEWVFTVRVHLAADATVGAEAVRDLQARTHDGVDRYLNRPGHRLPGAGVPMRVAVEFVDDPAAAHAHVQVVSAGTPGMNQRVWTAGAPAAEYAHEVLHHLGALDTRPPAGALLHGSAALSVPGDLMDVPDAGHPAVVTPAALAQIAAVLDAHWSGSAAGRLDEAGAPGHLAEPFWQSGVDTPPHVTTTTGAEAPAPPRVVVHTPDGEAIEMTTFGVTEGDGDLAVTTDRGATAASDVRPPWYVQAHALGSGAVQSVAARSAAEAATATDRILAALPTNDPAVTAAIRQPIIDLITSRGESADTERWQDLLDRGTMLVAGDRLIWLRPILDDLTPSTGQRPEGVYTVGFGSTVSSKKSTVARPVGLDAGLNTVVTLGSGAASAVIPGIPQLGIDSSRVDGSVEKTIAISGRKHFVKKRSAFDAGVAVEVYVDGVRYGRTGVAPGVLTADFPSEHVEGTQPPAATANPADNPDAGTMTPIRSHDVLNAVDVGPVIAGLQANLRQAGLSAATTRDIMDELTGTTLTEGKALNRSRWWVTVGDASTEIRVRDSARDVFSGHFVVRTELSSVQYLGTVGAVKVRDDMGINRTTGLSHGGSSAASVAGGVTVAGIEAPHADGKGFVAPLKVQVTSERSATQEVGETISHHTVLNRKSPQVRFRTGTRVTVTTHSTSHAVRPVDVVVETERAMPANEAGDFLDRVLGPSHGDAYRNGLTGPAPAPVRVRRPYAATSTGGGAEWNLAEQAPPELGEPLALAARRGAGFGVTTSLPGSSVVHDTLRDDILGDVRDRRGGLADFDRQLGSLVGQPVLEGDLPALLAGIHDQVTVRGRTYGVSVRGHLRSLRSNTEEPFPMDVNTRALHGDAVVGEHGDKLAVDVTTGGGAQVHLTEAVRMGVGGAFVTASGGRELADSLNTGVKTYSRTETTGDARFLTYDIAYEVHLDRPDGTRQTWWFDRPDELVATMVVPVEHAPAQPVTAAERDGLRFEPIDSLPSGAGKARLTTGTGGIHPSFMSMPELSEMAARMYAAANLPAADHAAFVSDWTRWPDPIRNLRNASDLESAFPQYADRRGRTTPLPRGSDGRKQALRVRLHGFRPRHLSTSDGVEIEQYSNATNKHAAKVKRSAGLSVTGRIGPQFRIGDSAHVADDASNGAVLENRSHSGGRVQFAGAASAGINRIRTKETERGGIDLTRATYSGDVHTYRFDPVFEVTLERWRGADRVVQTQLFQGDDALDLLVPDQRVADLDLPAPPGRPSVARTEAVTYAQPETAVATAHPETMKADAVLGAIVTRLRDQGLLRTDGVSTLDQRPNRLMRSLTARYRPDALRTQLVSLRGNGVWMWTPVSTIFGTRYLWVSVTARVDPAHTVVHRPEVKLTLRGEGVTKVTQGRGKGRGYGFGVEARGRWDGGDRHAGGEFAATWRTKTENSVKNAEQTLDIFRANTLDEGGSYAFSHVMHFRIEMGLRRDMPAILRTVTQPVRRSILGLANLLGDDGRVTRFYDDHQLFDWFDDGAGSEVDGSVRVLVAEHLVRDARPDDGNIWPLNAVRPRGTGPEWVPDRQPQRVEQDLATHLHPWTVPAASAFEWWSPLTTAPRNWRSSLLVRPTPVPGISNARISGAVHQHYVSPTMLRPSVAGLLRHEYETRINGRTVTFGLTVVRARPTIVGRFKGRRYQQQESAPERGITDETGWKVTFGPEGAGDVDGVLMQNRSPADLAGRVHEHESSAEIAEVVEKNKELVRHYQYYSFDVQAVVHGPQGTLVVDVDGGLQGMIPVEQVAAFERDHAGIFGPANLADEATAAEEAAQAAVSAANRSIAALADALHVAADHAGPSSAGDRVAALEAQVRTDIARAERMNRAATLRHDAAVEAGVRRAGDKAPAPLRLTTTPAPAPAVHKAPAVGKTPAADAPSPRERFSVPGDGRCQLYAVIAGDPVRVSERLAAAGLGSAGLHAWLNDGPAVRGEVAAHVASGERDDRGLVPGRSRLGEAAEQLRLLVARHLQTTGRATVPTDVVRAYRGAMHPQVADDATRMSRAELLNSLRVDGVRTVVYGHTLPVEPLREMFIDARTAELIAGGAEPAAARATAVGEVPLEPVAAGTGPTLAAGAPSMQGMLDYLNARGLTIDIDHLDDETLRAVFVQNQLDEGRLLDDGEFAALTDAVDHWESSWREPFGEGFVPLLAAALDARIRVDGPGGSQADPIGRPGAPLITVHRAGDHYSAMLSRPATTGNAAFDAAIAPAAAHGIDSMDDDRFYDFLDRSHEEGTPLAFIVNTILPHTEVDRIPGFIQAVTDHLEPGTSSRVAFVLAVNAPAGQEPELAAAITRARSVTGGLAHPVALVPATFTGPSFPYGTIRNAALHSAPTRQLAAGFIAGGRHPYVAVQDFDRGDRRTPSGRHVFDEVEQSLPTQPTREDQIESGDRSASRPLLVVGGYRVTDSGALVADVRRHYAANGFPVPAELVERPDEFVSRFVAEIDADMRVRQTLAAVHPLLPYGPEPNLLLDATVLLRPGHGIGFGADRGEFSGLATTVHRYVARELDERFGAGSAGSDERTVHSQNGRLPSRGPAVSTDFRGLAIGTDLGRLAVPSAVGHRAPAETGQATEAADHAPRAVPKQSHAYLNHVPERFFDSGADAGTDWPAYRDRYRPGTADHLAPIRDGRPAYEPDARVQAQLGSPEHTTMNPAVSLPGPNGTHVGIAPEHQVLSARAAALSGRTQTWLHLLDYVNRELVRAAVPTPVAAGSLYRRLAENSGATDPADIASAAADHRDRALAWAMEHAPAVVRYADQHDLDLGVLAAVLVRDGGWNPHTGDLAPRILAAALGRPVQIPDQPGRAYPLADPADPRDYAPPGRLAAPPGPRSALHAVIAADPARVGSALTAAGLGSPEQHAWLADPAAVRRDVAAPAGGSAADLSRLDTAAELLRELAERHLDGNGRAAGTDPGIGPAALTDAVRAWDERASAVLGDALTGLAAAAVGARVRISQPYADPVTLGDATGAPITLYRSGTHYDALLGPPAETTSPESPPATRPADPPPESPEARDAAYGAAVWPKKVKPFELDPPRGEDEKGAKGADLAGRAIRLNPAWMPLSAFDRELHAGRPDAHWHYVVTEEGEIFLGSEEIHTAVSEAQLNDLLAGMRTKDPDLTMDHLRSSIDRQGHPTIAAGFDSGGRAVAGRARISGELSRDPVTGGWVVNDKSGRYMSGKVRPRLDAADVQRWLDQVAARLTAHLGEPVEARPFKHTVAAPPPDDPGDPGIRGLTRPGPFDGLSLDEVRERYVAMIAERIAADGTDPSAARVLAEGHEPPTSQGRARAYLQQQGITVDGLTPDDLRRAYVAERVRAAGAYGPAVQPIAEQEMATEPDRARMEQELQEVRIAHP